MAKAFVIVVYILVLMMLAEGEFQFEGEIYPIGSIVSTSRNVECELGNGSCNSFYMKHQTEILVGIGVVGLLLLIGCFIWCCYCCCCKEKRGRVLETPRQTPVTFPV